MIHIHLWWSARRGSRSAGFHQPSTLVTTTTYTAPTIIDMAMHVAHVVDGVADLVVVDAGDDPDGEDDRQVAEQRPGCPVRSEGLTRMGDS